MKAAAREETESSVERIGRLFVDPRPRRSAVDEIASKIGASIELGLLAPLDRVPHEAELAGAFGVAPITVRRALNLLAADGVLSRRRGRGGGTFVAEDPPRQVLLQLERRLAEASGEIWEILDYRRVLESGAVSVAVEQASGRDVRSLVRRLRKLHPKLA